MGAMTATDELCRMLDERRVEYTEDRGYREFFWDFGEHGKARASSIGTRGLVQMIITGITPAQAIAATLGDEGVGRSNDGVAELEAENARLRELVRGLLSGYACGRGRLCDECSWDGLGDPHTFACPVRVRARELGVEVNDG